MDRAQIARGLAWARQHKKKVATGLFILGYWLYHGMSLEAAVKAGMAAVNLLAPVLLE